VLIVFVLSKANEQKAIGNDEKADFFHFAKYLKIEVKKNVVI
jgi:hypothetical protein